MKTGMVVAALLLCTFSVNAQNSAVDWFAMSEGFNMQSSSPGLLRFSVGQPFVGRASGVNRTVESGFFIHSILRGIITSVPVGPDFPVEFRLDQNYPNPFNPSTIISFQIPTAERVVLKVYNILGQEVATLMDDRKEAGAYEVTWNPRDASSGMYFYRLNAGERSQTRKLMIVK